MTKKEFTDYLDKRLAVLADDEREDIKQELLQHIDFKIQNGMTESEAIDTLGDIRSIVDNMLGAYNIDPTYDDSANERKRVHNEVKEKLRRSLEAIRNSEPLNNGIDAVHGFVKNNSPAEIFKLMLVILASLVIGLFLFSVGYAAVDVLARIATHGLPQVLWFRDIIGGIIRLIYIAFAILIFICAISTAFKKYMQNNADRKQKADTAYLKEGEKMTEVIEKPQSNGSKLLDILIFIIRIFVGVAMIPAICSLVGLVCAEGLFLAVLLMGFPVLGLNIILIGIILCMASFLGFVIKLVFFEKGVSKNEN